jgi:predicted Zn-dependent protease
MLGAMVLRRLAAGAAILAAVLALAPARASAQSASVRARAVQAQRAMSKGRFEEAAAIYRELAEMLPAEPGILMNLGMALAMAGREQEAIDPLERALQQQPSLVPARMFLGSSYLALGQPDKALPLLERVVTLKPKDAESRRLASRAALDAGKPERAVVHLRELSALRPADPAAWYALAQAYNAMVQQALETFDRDPPDSPWRALLLADALEQDARVNEAFELYKDVLPKLPMPSVHESLARIYDKTGHPDWAAEQRRRAPPLDCAARTAACDFRADRFRSALAATDDREDPESRYWRARAATELAQEAFARLEKLPDSQELHEYRAELARSQNRHADAAQEIRLALKSAPGDPRLREELALSLYLARDYEGALAALKGLTNPTTASPSLALLYGDSLLQLQRVEEAIPWLELAIKGDGSNPDAQAALGRAYVQKGSFAAAIPLLEPLLHTDRDGSLHFQLARAFQATGAADKAAPLLERYRELQQATQARATGQTGTKITPP